MVSPEGRTSLCPVRTGQGWKWELDIHTHDGGGPGSRHFHIACLSHCLWESLEETEMKVYIRELNQRKNQ